MNLSSRLKNLARLTTPLLLMVCHNLAFAEVGFYRLNSGKAPAPVVAAAKSVYRLDQLYGKFVVLDGRPAIEARLAHLEDHFERHNIYREEQLHFCLDAGLDICVFVDDEFRLAQGTAFVFGNDKTIFTALHVVHDQLMAFYQYCRHQKNFDHPTCVRMIKERPLFVVLSDQDGKPVYKSQGKNRLTITSITDEEQLYDPSAFERGVTVFKQAQDVVRLTSSVALGQPLKPARAGLASFFGKPAYIVGFPGPTTDRLTCTGKPDSDGTGQYFTYGEVLSAFEAESRVRLAEHRPIEPNSKAQTDYFEQFKIYLWGDGYAGQSGAPVLDNAGEVIGLFSESSELNNFDMRSTLPHGLNLHQMLSVGAASK